MKNLFLLTLFMGLISCSRQEVENSITTGNVIGGTLAQPSEFKSTILITEPSCTATKIGPRTFLTAAHCIVDKYGELRENFKKGSMKLFFTHYTNGGSIMMIAESHVHSSYVDGIASSLKENLAADSRKDRSYDVGVFTVEDETPEIPVASINYRPIEQETQVTIGGYGCENQVNEAVSVLDRRYKIHKTWALPLSMLKILTSDEEQEKHIFVTPGARLGKEFASLCQGDSGGAVYLAEDNSVVGVNSFVMATSDDLSGTFMQFHVRLHELKDWLEGILQQDK